MRAGKKVRYYRSGTKISFFGKTIGEWRGFGFNGFIENCETPFLGELVKRRFMGNSVEDGRRAERRKEAIE